MLLEKIEKVNDIKQIDSDDWDALAQEIRQFLQKRHPLFHQQ